MGRPRKYDRDDVLNKAMKLFWTKGYEGTHLKELVEVTGINRFSLYKEFGGKEGLFMAALAAYMEELASFSAIYDRKPLGLQNIRDAYQALLEFGTTHGCFAVNLIREKFVVPGDAFAKVTSMVEGTEGRYLANLRAAREAGDLAPAVDIEGLAKLLTSLNIGIVNYLIVSPDGDGPERLVKAVDHLWT
ncbi:MAG: TetR/AcrR family transcriptional regulator [Candidatus Krumholzibacteriota bacterium]